MLDEGLIEQKDYDAKKKELLGLQNKSLTIKPHIRGVFSLQNNWLDLYMFD